MHDIVWYCMELNYILWYCIVLQCIVLYCMVSYYILQYCIVGFGAQAVSRKTPIYFIYIYPIRVKDEDGAEEEDLEGGGSVVRA